MGRMKELCGDEPVGYPNAPGFKAYGTSSLAARQIDARGASALRELVLAAISSSIRGMTADEVAAKLNQSVLAVRPRVSELSKQGRIRESGERRPNLSGMKANVYVAG